MPHYTDKGQIITDQAKQETTVVKVNDEDSIVNMYIRHGMIIRNVDTGKNWKLLVAEPEQTIVGKFKDLAVLTPAS